MSIFAIKFNLSAAIVIYISIHDKTLYLFKILVSTYYSFYAYYKDYTLYIIKYILL